MELEPLRPTNNNNFNDYNNSYSNHSTDTNNVDIDNRELNTNTNYVFFFGIGQSGKSVILSTMLYYIDTQEGVLEPNNNARNNQEANLLLNNFRENIRKGILPNRTTKGEVKELNFTFTPDNLSEKVKPINLTFLEIAGEDLANDLRVDNGFPDHIAQYLYTDIPISFIIVTSYDNAHNDDAIIKQFLSEIKLYGKNPKKFKMILVISKWDKSGRMEPRVGTDRDELEDFVNRNLPMTSKYLDVFQFNVEYYTAGKIDDNNIISLNQKSAKILSHWLYESIVGYPLGYEGTLWERIKWGITGK